MVTLNYNGVSRVNFPRVRKNCLSRVFISQHLSVNNEQPPLVQIKHDPLGLFVLRWSILINYSLQC